MLLYGKNAVHERLKVNPGSIKEIFLQDNFKDSEIINLIEKRKVLVKYLSARDMERKINKDRVQGIVAEVEAFKYTPFEELLKPVSWCHGVAVSRNDDFPIIIFLDRVNDPHNLGSILRTAACMGGFALCIPKHDSCEVNETVLHVASGGENFVPVAMVSNMTSAIIEAKKAGFWIAGTVVDDAEYINEVSFNYPLGLVLGSEGEGIREGLHKHLDYRVTLPMKGASLSYNVAIACALACWSVRSKVGT